MENEKHYCVVQYKSIDDLKSFSYNDAFIGENGNVTNQLPSLYWINTFSEQGGETWVNIAIKHKNLADLGMILAMGLKEGFTAGLNNLEEVLAKR